MDVTGGLIVDDRTALVSFARQGLGLAYVSDLEVRSPVVAGLLEPLLQPFIPSDLGLYLYFPKRSQSQLKLRAFIDARYETWRRNQLFWKRCAACPVGEDQHDGRYAQFRISSSNASRLKSPKILAHLLQC